MKLRDELFPQRHPERPDTYYILWDTHNVPLAPATWTNVAHLYYTNGVQVDKSAAYGTRR